MGLLDPLRRQAPGPTEGESPDPARTSPLFAVIDVETTGLDPDRHRPSRDRDPAGRRARTRPRPVVRALPSRTDPSARRTSIGSPMPTSPSARPVPGSRGHSRQVLQDTGGHRAQRRVRHRLPARPDFTRAGLRLPRFTTYCTLPGARCTCRNCSGARCRSAARRSASNIREHIPRWATRSPPRDCSSGILQSRMTGVRRPSHRHPRAAGEASASPRAGPHTFPLRRRPR